LPNKTPKELEAIVPGLAIPIQLLLEGSSRPYAVFKDYWKYEWVFPVYRYATRDISETVSPLARMARLIIADLTDPEQHGAAVSGPRLSPDLNRRGGGASSAAPWWPADDICSLRALSFLTRSGVLPAEAGEHFLVSIDGNLDALQAAIAEAAAHNSEPAGVLKVSMSPSIGLTHILPLLPPLLARYPRITPEWHFENRPVDLIAENYDAAIGGGFDLAPGLVSRTLAPVHVVAVASPAYMSGRTPPVDPSELAAYNGIVMRSLRTGRIRHWMLRNANGIEVAGTITETIVVNDPAAVREAARLGLGVSLIALFDYCPNWSVAI
jgi:hypothetical protein